MITLSVDIDRLQRNVSSLQFHMDQTPGMAAAAIRDTIDEWRKIAVNSVAAEFNVNRDEIDDRIGVTRPVRPDKWLVEAAVFLKSKPIKLKRFSPVQVAKGVAVRVHRQKSAQVIRGAFGPGIRRLGGGVYRRTTKKRLPIERIGGISLAEDPVARKALQDSERQVAPILYRNLEQRIQELAAATRRGQTIYEFMSWSNSNRATNDVLKFDFQGVGHRRSGFYASVDSSLADSGYTLSTGTAKKNYARHGF